MVCFDRKFKGYPNLYEKKSMNDYEMKFDIKFNINVADKERVKGVAVELTKQTLIQQLPFFELEGNLNYSFDGEDIKDLQVWEMMSTTPLKNVSAESSEEYLSPMQRIMKKTKDALDFTTPEKQSGNKKIKK